MSKPGKRGAMVTVVCEDKQQDCFFTRLLKDMGFARCEVYVPDYPAGKGAGTKHVIDSFPAEARKQRAKATHMKRGLVAVIDADTGTVDQRYKQLLDQSRGKDEKIAIFVPKRNIETWIAYLKDGTAVNETDEYPKLEKHEGECQPAVDRLIEITRQGVLADCPPSLQRAVTDEMPRLP